MVDKESGVLGFYDLKSKNLVSYEDNVIKSKTYKKPGNFKDYEKNHLVLIWGEETPQELFNKIISQETKELKGGIGYLVFLSMNVKKKNEVRECFNMIKEHDEELYNSFGKDILERMGLKSTEKNWWEFW
tara:strand:+ start:654 stop:1043 length:390 start_codon:yes stop_codon:yes gene_type:complete